MDLGTRKLPGSGEAPWKPLGKVLGSHQIGSFWTPSSTQKRIARKCNGVFKKNEPQETLNSLFTCLGSSVKDP